MATAIIIISQFSECNTMCTVCMNGVFTRSKRISIDWVCGV